MMKFVESAPTYSTDYWGWNDDCYIVDASDLARVGTPLWGWHRDYQNAGAWFKSHRTGVSRFFQVIEHAKNDDGDTLYWLLQAAREGDGTKLKVFND